MLGWRVEVCVELNKGLKDWARDGVAGCENLEWGAA